VKKNNCGGRLSFKTQVKIEYLLLYTGSRKVLENIPENSVCGFLTLEHVVAHHDLIVLSTNTLTGTPHLNSSLHSIKTSSASRTLSLILKRSGMHEIDI
jgi:hypothetical protein